MIEFNHALTAVTCWKLSGTRAGSIALAVLLSGLVAGLVPQGGNHAAASGSQQLVSNGGFESGSSPWTQSSANAHALITTTKPHTGSSSAHFCGTNLCTDQLAQPLTVPSSASSLSLSFWVFLSTTETSPFCTDSFTAQLKTTAGAVITTASTLCNTNATTSWVQQTVDLSSALAPYKGQQVQLVFLGRTNTLFPTDFFLDDVSLAAVSSASTNPTLTPTLVPTATTTPTSTPTPVSTATRTPTAVPTATSGAGSTATCPGTADQCALYLLNLLNSHRSQAGRSALSINWTQTHGTGSCVGAYGHSVHMAQTGQLSHDQFPADLCIPYSTAGENVGKASYGNEATDLQQVDTQMMSEPHDPAYCAQLAAQNPPSTNHACNILSAGFQQVGIGVYNTNGSTYLTEDFTN